MTENEPARPAAGTPGTSRTGGAVARRGDLVVIHLRHRDWQGGQPREYDDFWLGQVTSVTRAGLGPPVPARRHLRLGGRRARPARPGPATAVPVVRACRDPEPEGDRRLRCPRHSGLPRLAGPRRSRPRLRHPRRGQGRAEPAPAGASRLGTAPRRGRSLGGRLAGSPPAAERGGPRPRRGIPPPAGPLRRRRDRRQRRLPRAGRAGGRDRERGGI